MKNRVNATLSRHATVRFKQRFNTDISDLLININYGKLGVFLGRGEKGLVQHRMVWLEEHQAPIILIQNTIDGIVRTVLTLSQYQERYTGRCTDAHITKARNQYINRQNILKKFNKTIQL